MVLLELSMWAGLSPSEAGRTGKQGLKEGPETAPALWVPGALGRDTVIQEALSQVQLRGLFLRTSEPLIQ